VVVPLRFLFLSYVHSASCYIDNTSFFQQPQQQQLTSSLQPVCMLLLLTLLPTTLLSIEAADDGVTSDLQHNYLHSSIYRAYCLELHFIAVSHSTVNYVILLLWTFSMFGTQEDFYLW
jgi:hypothetical protein